MLPYKKLEFRHDRADDKPLFSIGDTFYLNTDASSNAIPVKDINLALMIEVEVDGINMRGRTWKYSVRCVRTNQPYGASVRGNGKRIWVKDRRYHQVLDLVNSA